MKPILYILFSAEKNRYYIGSTNNLPRRLYEHNTQQTITTRHGDYKLVFKQEFENLFLARRAELKLKKWKRRDIIEEIIRDGKMKSV